MEEEEEEEEKEEEKKEEEEEMIYFCFFKEPAHICALLIMISLLDDLFSGDISTQ